MISWFHSYYPSPTLLSLGPVNIHWYGLLVVLGFLAGLAVVVYLFKKYSLPVNQAYDLFFYLIIFGLIGARIYYVLYSWEYYSQHLSEVIKVWRGGLAIHGAIIAALVTLYFYCRQKKYSFGLLTDIIATAVPLSLAIGRWGNYFNQELFGRPTNLPWGIGISWFNRPAAYQNFEYFHPTFLYESLLDLIVFGVLMLLHRRRLGRTEDKRWVSRGNITLSFLLLYSVVRFNMEFLRLDSSPVVFGVRWAQLVSAIIFVGILVFWLVQFFRNKKTT
ncbi:MAG: prolipoprotein diacylglyceryl transferase [Patescibacteria group bacterium]